MHNRIPPLFKVSTLAAAVLALSGCASSSLPNGIGESIGGTIVSAGKATANVSAKAVDTAVKVVGLDRLTRNNSGQELDGAEVALNESEEAWPVAQTTALGDAPARIKIPTGEDLPGGMPAIASMPAVDPNAVPVATVDYTHVVGQQETMWTIAKSTTGNANNWRILAEINQLDLNTPMQIGQEILVPADLVLPEIVGSLTPSPLLDASAPIAIETADAANQDPLQELPPLNLDGEANGTMQPVTQASLESDPLKPATAADSFTGEDGEELIIVEASAQEASTPEAVLDPTYNAVALKADAGETLWDMAKRTTGDATNWKQIATHNGFSEKDIGRIRYGQTIYVPNELAKAELGGDKVEEQAIAAVELAKPDTEADAAATDDLVAASTNVQPATNEASVEATAELVASANNLMDETQDIKIVEAKYQSTDVVEAAPSDATQGNQIIMVSGTYYPKAVYNDADFSSSLLMRVSPGTEMMVSRAMGPWFEVQTENGIGYMHSRDIK